MSKLIRSDSAEGAVAELLETHCLSGSTLAIFRLSRHVGQRPSYQLCSRIGSQQVWHRGCLFEFCQPHTISKAHSAVSWISQQTGADIPFIVSPRPVSWLRKDRGDWCKGHFLSTLIETEPHLRIFYSDDRWDILRDIRTLTRASEKLRLVHCDENTSIAQAVAQWSLAAKGGHFLDRRGVRLVRETR